MTPKERCENFIKNGLTPFFKAQGFKKKGNKFVLYGDKLTYAFYPLRGKYNSAEDMDFALYFALYTRDFDQKKNISSYVQSLLEGNVARISKNTQCYYSWITFKIEDDEPEKQDQQIKNVLLKDLEEKIMPYVLKLKTVQDVIHLIENTPEREQFWAIPTRGTQTIRDLAIYYWILGQKQQAIETLDKGIASTDERVRAPQFRAGAIQDLEETKQRILNGPDHYVRKSLDSLI